MKDQELFYAFTDTDADSETFNSKSSKTSAIIARIQPFIEDHVDDVELRKLVQRSFAANEAIYYACEDFSFSAKV